MKMIWSGYHEDPSQVAAVKCVIEEYFKVYETEIQILRALNHPNVVRYFATQTVEQNHFIAMEKGICNLEEFANADIAFSENLTKVLQISAPSIKEIKPLRSYLIKLLHDSCVGLQCMHEKRIVHRDINPHNILVMIDSKGFVGKLSDFGLSKNLPILLNTVSSEPCGTYDYMPPEVINALDRNERSVYSTKTDIHSMGISMFRLLSRGEHPGGIPSRRAGNIKAGHLDFERWTSTDPPLIQFQSCIERMLHVEREQRVSINFVLNHPWSWEPKKNLDFTVAVANYLAPGESVSKSDRNELRGMLSSAMKINEAHPELGWWGNLCQNVRDYIENPRPPRKTPKKYEHTDFCKLVKFIRDKDQHFSEIPDDLKSADIFGADECSFISYFTQRFPGLISILYTFFERRRTIPCFKVYYQE
jgi:serine/threonine-protein kinase/endoribonuclease IRE1